MVICREVVAWARLEETSVKMELQCLSCSWLVDLVLISLLLNTATERLEATICGGNVLDKENKQACCCLVENCMVFQRVHL